MPQQHPKLPCKYSEMLETSFANRILPEVLMVAVLFLTCPLAVLKNS